MLGSPTVKAQFSAVSVAIGLRCCSEGTVIPHRFAICCAFEAATARMLLLCSPSAAAVIAS